MEKFIDETSKLNNIFSDILRKCIHEEMILDKLIDNNYNFEECCNEGLRYALKHQHFRLFDVCIKCSNIKLSELLFCYEYSKNICHPHFIRGFSDKGKHFSLADIEGKFNTYITNTNKISDLTTFYIEKGCHIYNEELYFIKPEILIDLMKLGYKPRSINRIFTRKLKYNRYEDIGKLIEFIDIDYTLINIYKEIRKSFRKRIIDKKKAYEQLIEHTNGKLYLENFTEYAKGIFHMIYNDCQSYNSTKRILKNEVLPNFDKYYEFNYFNEIKNCFEKIKQVFNDYFYKKLRIKHDLQKKLPNEIIDLVQSYY